MVKHNNVLPNVHFRKDWKSYVRTWFDQPGRKHRRYENRQKKLAKMGTRPVDSLRPVVHPPTQRYNMKTRLGRGFTLEELKAAGVSPKFALTVGISVDHRRRNHCEESLAANTERIKEYLKRLVVFPRKSGQPKKGTAGLPADKLGARPTPEELKEQKQAYVKGSKQAFARFANRKGVMKA
eukprot:GHVO01052966.1.p1 GENE.GHVO01052966.1~~GHVO01052966.1.p1  ORF type:complete len:181 (+),score=21.86 GHVO01052966.1:14-556(+)